MIFPSIEVSSWCHSEILLSKSHKENLLLSAILPRGVTRMAREKNHSALEEGRTFYENSCHPSSRASDVHCDHKKGEHPKEWWRECYLL